MQLILRGLRDFADFSYELRMSYMNQSLLSNIESIFLISSSKNFFISSSLIRDIFYKKGNYRKFVPSIVYQALLKKINNQTIFDI